MSDHIAQAIRSLEQEIEAIDQRRGELQRAIDAMRPLAGDGRSTRKLNRAAKRNERTNERAKRAPTGTRPRSLPDDAVGPQETGRRTKILAGLKDGPRSLRDLKKELKLSGVILKSTLHQLRTEGEVTTVGVGPGTKWMLPMKRAAKEAP